MQQGEVTDIPVDCLDQWYTYLSPPLTATVPLSILNCTLLVLYKTFLLLACCAMCET